MNRVISSTRRQQPPPPPPPWPPRQHRIAGPDDPADQHDADQHDRQREEHGPRRPLAEDGPRDERRRQHLEVAEDGRQTRPDVLDRVVPERQVAGEEDPGDQRQPDRGPRQRPELPPLQVRDRGEERQPEQAAVERAGRRARPPTSCRRSPRTRSHIAPSSAASRGRAAIDRERAGQVGRGRGRDGRVAQGSASGAGSTGRDQRSRVRTRTNPSDSYRPSAPSLRPLTDRLTFGMPSERTRSTPARTSWRPSPLPWRSGRTPIDQSSAVVAELRRPGARCRSLQNPTSSPVAALLDEDDVGVDVVGVVEAGRDDARDRAGAASGGRRRRR